MKCKVASAVALCFLAMSAKAHAVCGERAIVLDLIMNNYQETRIAYGNIHNQGAVEVFQSKEKDTWSILLTAVESSGKKRSCIIASGNEWRDSNKNNVFMPKHWQY